MKTRIREILSDLDSVRENLLALSDDIWLSMNSAKTATRRSREGWPCRR